MESQRWHQLYEVAVLELDPMKLKERIEAAEVAIGEREIKLRSIGAPIEELTMIADARRTLTVLRSNELRPAHPQTMSRSA
jgi:hypothetical protein